MAVLVGAPTLTVLASVLVLILNDTSRGTFQLRQVVGEMEGFLAMAAITVPVVSYTVGVIPTLLSILCYCVVASYLPRHWIQWTAFRVFLSSEVAMPVCLLLLWSMERLATAMAVDEMIDATAYWALAIAAALVGGLCASLFSKPGSDALVEVRRRGERN